MKGLGRNDVIEGSQGNDFLNDSDGNDYMNGTRQMYTNLHGLTITTLERLIYPLLN